MFRVLQKIDKYDIISNGEFKLKSGEKSNIYIDFKKAISHPDLIKEICSTLYSENIISSDEKILYDYVLGIPYGGLPFSNNLSLLFNIPGLTMRKEAKDYGKCNLIEGDLDKFNKQKCKILVIEDVVTTGQSAKSIVDILKKKGHHITVISIVDRSNGNVTAKSLGADEYKYLINVPVHEMIEMTKNEIFMKLVNINIFDKLKKKSKICFSCDLNKFDDVIKSCEEIGDNIGIVKLHVDMFPDFTHEKMYKLKQIALKKNFLLWEDRKFADIGRVMIRQLTNKTYSIFEWADIISIHGIVGEESIKNLNDLGIMCFIVSELSTKNNLIDNKYTEKCLEIASNTNSIVGCVCQSKISDKYLHIVPGISDTKLFDDMGQTYSKITDKGFADFFVIGSALYKSEKPSEKIIQFNTIANSLK